MAGLEIELRPMRKGATLPGAKPKAKKELLTAAEELIQAIANEDAQAAAMAIQDAVECISKGEDAYATDEE